MRPRLTAFTAQAQTLSRSARVRRYLSSFRQNPGLVVLSLVLSFGLWLLVTNDQNPPRADFFPTEIPVKAVNVSSDLDVPGPLMAVRARVTAPADLWTRLDVHTIEATVDLAGFREGIYDIPVRVTSRDSRVRVTDVVPPVVRVDLEALQEALIPVTVNVAGEAAQGYVVEPAQVSPSQVKIQGPASRVRLVQSAAIDINVDGRRTGIEQTARLIPRSASGSEVEDVILSPQAVTVRVTLRQQAQVLDVVVRPRFRGAVAAGFGIVRVQVDPPVVPLRGPEETLRGLDFVQTDEIDLGGAMVATERQVGIDVPSGATLVGPAQVRVTIGIAPVQTTGSYYIAPQLQGVPPETRARLDPATVQVTLQGLATRLSALQSSDLTVILTLESARPGTYSVAPSVQLPPGVTLVGVKPDHVAVIIPE